MNESVTKVLVEQPGYTGSVKKYLYLKRTKYCTHKIFILIKIGLKIGQKYFKKIHFFYFRLLSVVVYDFLGNYVRNGSIYMMEGQVQHLCPRHVGLRVE